MHAPARRRSNQPCSSSVGSWTPSQTSGATQCEWECLRPLFRFRFRFRIPILITRFVPRTLWELLVTVCQGLPQMLSQLLLVVAKSAIPRVSQHFFQQLRGYEGCSTTFLFLGVTVCLIMNVVTEVVPLQDVSSSFYLLPAHAYDSCSVQSAHHFDISEITSTAVGSFPRQFRTVVAPQMCSFPLPVCCSRTAQASASRCNRAGRSSKRCICFPAVSGVLETALP